MSSKGLAVLAAERTTASPTKKDLGRGRADSMGDDIANIGDALVTLIPTGAITGYTLLLSGIVSLVDSPTATIPKPDQLSIYRWLAFAALIILSTTLFLFSYYSTLRQSGRRFPILETMGTTLAAAVWGLTVPESPLQPYLDGKNRTLIPLFILVIGGTMITSAASLLTKPVKRQEHAN